MDASTQPIIRHFNTLHLLIVGIVMLMVGLGGGFLLFSNKTTGSSNSTQRSTPAASIPSMSPPLSQGASTSDVFNTIQQQIQAERKNLVDDVERLTDEKTWWISADNWNIFVPSQESLLAKIRPSDLGIPNKAEITKLNAIVKHEMINNGFTLNNQNSSKNESDNKFYDYVQAYEKQNMLCVATSDPDVGRVGDETQDYSRFTFSCFTQAQLQAAYAQQIPFLKALNDKTVIIRDLTVSDDKAKVSIQWRRTGAVAFMYKSDNDWKLVHEGQALPNCSALQTKNIPSQYWVDCLEGNGVKKGNFNF